MTKVKGLRRKEERVTRIMFDDAGVPVAVRLERRDNVYLTGGMRARRASHLSLHIRSWLERSRPMWRPTAKV